MKNWFWPLAVGTCGRVLHNAPDAGGPGGPTDGGAPAGDAGPSASDAGGDSPSDTGDAGLEPQTRVDGDDEVDDEDAGFDQRYHDDLKARDPKAAKKYRNAINRSRDAAPLLQTLRTLGIDPKDRNAVAAFVRNGVTPKQPAIAPAAPQPAARTEPAKPKWVPLKTDEPFDDSPFRGWDLTEPSNKALHEHLRGAHETRMQNRMLANGFVAMAEKVDALEAQLKNFEDGGKREKTEAKVKQWSSVVSDAAGKITDKDTRETFRHAVAGEARFERSQGREPDIQAIVGKHLKRLQRKGDVSASDVARATAAAQGIADRNRSAPSRAALAPGGSPASPRVDRSSERIGDVARRLGVRSYGGR